MMARILPPEEWSKLDVTRLPSMSAVMSPEDVTIVAVEVDDHVVATMAVLNITHFEDLWIANDHRDNAGTVRSLLREAAAAAKPSAWVWATSDTDKTKDFI